MTLASEIGKLLPGRIYSFLKPKYHFFRAKSMLKKRGGSYSYDKVYGGWRVHVPMPKNGKMLILARTFKEFNRAARFGSNKKDLVWKWLNWVFPNQVVYDVGSANGLEGFTASHLNNSQVIFVEPYTPSIETILKTVSLTKIKKPKCSFEIVHAACSNKEDYKKLLMHGLPLPGETLNTYGSRLNYEEGGGRERKNVTFSQWVKGITLDALHYNYNLKIPQFIKIDVDGHEDQVINGSKKIIRSQKVKSWAIEITGEKRIKYITRIMTKHNYIIAGDFDHYPGYKPQTIDRIFVKKNLIKSWNNFKIE